MTMSPRSASQAPFTPHVSPLTPTTGAVVIDMARFNGRYVTHDLTGDVTYSSLYRGPGFTTTIKIAAGAATRTFTFPAGWVFVNGKPTDIASGKTGILTITWFGSTEASALAAWAVEA